ncbi:SRPBCC domain-containing protein [Zhihengliuella halotolerans]|uniref:SRPBCC domain-containing protein n=1 Tax=Zhihengliuella halotolerans TaxID=370736 RepID=UPI002155A97D|nr:SRPBCC domain-containing protein [Zhihengliuella halotolerans]
MRIDRASRHIAAGADAVLSAFTEPAAFRAWLPPAGMSGRLERFDPRIGGGFRMVLTYDDPPAGGGKSGADTDTAEARIAELGPRRIVWLVDFPSDDPAASGTMTMVWSLTPDDAGTLVSVEASDVPEAIAPEAHTEGLASSLANLAAVIEHPSRGSIGP